MDFRANIPSLGTSSFNDYNTVQLQLADVPTILSNSLWLSVPESLILTTLALWLLAFFPLPLLYDELQKKVWGFAKRSQVVTAHFCWHCRNQHPYVRCYLLSLLHALYIYIESHGIFRTTIKGSYYQCSHFPDKETESQSRKARIQKQAISSGILTLKYSHCSKTP